MLRLFCCKKHMPYAFNAPPLCRSLMRMSITGNDCRRQSQQTNKQTNVFVKPRTSPFTGGHSSHALRLGPLGGSRRTQMRSSALGVLPQCPRGLMLDCARHTSHCESNFGSFCRGCPTQRSRVPSSVCRPRLVSLAVLFGGCVASGILLG